MFLYFVVVAAVGGVGGDVAAAVAAVVAAFSFGISGFESGSAAVNDP